MMQIQNKVRFNRSKLRRDSFIYCLASSHGLKNHAYICHYHCLPQISDLEFVYSFAALATLIYAVWNLTSNVRKLWKLIHNVTFVVCIFLELNDELQSINEAMTIVILKKFVVNFILSLQCDCEFILKQTSF